MDTKSQDTNTSPTVAGAQLNNKQDVYHISRENWLLLCVNLYVKPFTDSYTKNPTDQTEGHPKPTYNTTHVIHGAINTNITFYIILYINYI